ncbi:MAG: NUDIX domain-containing protein [Candidatus Thermoplasmatota archaeon]|nr:NUDIX domain-containing protein [Euryarchaeota archaeon]MBU4033018.1 NUDIX domain-containing protein [Candidatus Thermoplasmatota archaeon]MBU4070632.1 NUDIX domain-containing protein [Candidatus Thermoplasmatota archaeon]MBU4145127.1 NUDIX domain-containing protein [Candidatus Thermoplasmatota archaeon]MBU4591577.1 NUDIX domain-containing protein [Candidatus Thermoplasmatota archaeon]
MKEPSLTGRADPGKPTHPVTSSGGVILDSEGRVLVLRRKTEGTWVLPKGRMEPGENLRQTALREVQEETGLSELKIIREIGLVRYIFFWRPENINYKKTVHYFLMKLNNGKEPEMKLEPNFAEHSWTPVDDAVKLLTFENDRRIVRAITIG